MFIQKDTNVQVLDSYLKAQKNATKIDYSDIYKIKPQKPTTNLIENQRVSSLKNAPIKNSDKKEPPVIRPYSKFKGAEALPTFKKDLKAWSLVC